ncbi:MAG: DUF167 domain-containing protein [Chloroflexota bacterium]
MDILVHAGGNPAAVVHRLRRRARRRLRIIKLLLQVRPSAARNEITGFAGGALQVKVAAPPVRGEANRELIAFLSQALGISRGSLTIVKGHTSRSKVIDVDGLSQPEVMKRLWPGSSGGATTRTDRR